MGPIASPPAWGVVMTSLLGRVIVDGDAARLRSGGAEVAEVERRLEAGEAPAEVAAGLGLQAVDMVAALAFLGLGPGGSEGPGLVQAHPARAWVARAVTDDALAALRGGSDRRSRLALAAGLLQIHDHWDASHRAAQEADDLGERAASAYWHGIAHRREPDAGNASYWFRRVGRHPLFDGLGADARRLIDEEGRPEGARRLAASASWDPFAFIELVSSARPVTPLARLARRLQRLEMDRLLAATWEHVVR